MYPNYTKAFLNLEGVFIKKVVQADSFIKIFIQSQPCLLYTSREAVRNIRETAQLAQFERYNAWFDHTLLPLSLIHI